MFLLEYVDPPMLTADLPGIGGGIRGQLEDFQVEEIPSYEPSGEGEHLFLWIEKKNVSAEWLLKMVAKRLDMSKRDIGCAGLKDRHAITRQYLSVPTKLEDRIDKINSDDIKVLHSKRHGNKIKTGHQKGNKFIVRIRGVSRDQAPAVDAILAMIAKTGLPNYYGEQRFGHNLETLDTGLKLLRKEPVRVTPFLRKLSLSAVQSLLFNAVLGRRLRDGLLSTVLPGDVMQKVSGGLFVAENFPEEQERFDRRETIHAGPIFGRKTFAAKADAAERELRVLAESGLTPASFEGFGNLVEGTRRANLVHLGDLQTEWDDAGLILKFSLPSGSYATVLLREVMKNAGSVEPMAVLEESLETAED